MEADHYENFPIASGLLAEGAACAYPRDLSGCRALPLTSQKKASAARPSVTRGWPTFAAGSTPWQAVTGAGASADVRQARWRGSPV